jgi:hypothetical protein
MLVKVGVSVLQRLAEYAPDLVSTLGINGLPRANAAAWQDIAATPVSYLQQLGHFCGCARAPHQPGKF